MTVRSSRVAIAAGIVLIAVMASTIAWGPLGQVFEREVGIWQNAVADRLSGPGALLGWRLYGGFACGLAGARGRHDDPLRRRLYARAFSRIAICRNCGGIPTRSRALGTCVPYCSRRSGRHRSFDLCLRMEPTLASAGRHCREGEPYGG